MLSSTRHMEKTLRILNDLERDGILQCYAIARLIAAKEERRHNLAGLPFPEKVLIVVRLQQMAAPLLRARGKRGRTPIFAFANRLGSCT